MRATRRILGLTLLGLAFCLTFLPATAEEAVEPAELPVACPAPQADGDLADLFAPEAVNATCSEMDCFDDWDCETECPSANSAVCTSEGFCVYQFGSPSSGSGSCPEMDCTWDSDCAAECPNASMAICTMSGVCFYG